MANSLLLPVRSALPRLCKSLIRRPDCFNQLVSRRLYDNAFLGIDSFLQQRKHVQQHMQNMIPKFREKMASFIEQGEQSMVFTEDLKNMVYLAETDEDMELLVKMLKKFNNQNKQLRFGSFVFGPVVMRLFHLHKKTDLALECFNAPELDGLFDQLSTYQIILDLLYETEHYDDVLKTFEKIISRQMAEVKYPKNVVVLAMAACYKLNSPQSLEYALKLWQDLLKAGHFPMRKAATFCASLAVKQGRPDAALEIISNVRNTNYTTVRNIKVAALTALGRIEDTIPIFKSILAEDVPENTVHTFNHDVFESVKKAILELDNADLALEINKLEKIFNQQGNISQKTLDEQLCDEIVKSQTLNDNRRPNQPRTFYNPEKSNKFGRYQQRPGLREYV